MTRSALLVVLAGRPGTGKTTLGRLLAERLPATYLRIDAVETVVIRYGLARPPVGPVGYGVAHEIARGNLELGGSVVVDAVNAVPEARAGWRHLSDVAEPVFLETVLPDEQEHRRRVERRRPDLPDQVVPDWAEVAAREYVPWDEARDGPRHVVDMTRTGTGLATALAHLGSVAAR